MSQWPLPQGVVDLLYEDAAGKRHLENSLRTCFRAWGYAELISPIFEYADTLTSEAGAQLAEEMYRFTDRDGRTLALRPDLTIPAARVAATRLHNEPLPLRLCYSGSVFRYAAPQAGRQREFTQAGIELIGSDAAAADAEVLALTVEALRAADLRQFQLALGQMAFFHGLLQELDAPPAAQHALQSAIDRKNPVDLAASIDELHLSPPLRAAFTALPGLSGGTAALHAARAFCLNPAMHAALDRLEAIHELLAAYGAFEEVRFDLGETRGMAYYTGITFKGYTRGLGAAICSGGRYDDLLGHFGYPQPAVGCALWLDRIILARNRQGWQPAAPREALHWHAGACAACFRVVKMLRSAGWPVILDLNADAHAAGVANTHRGPARIVVCAGGDEIWLQTADRARRLSLDALVEEVATW